MAKITKSAAAPADAETFSLGNASFSLTHDNPVFETENADLIANARLNAWLSVEEPAVPVEQQSEDYDPNDPFDNPPADHLSLGASAKAKEAAAANEAAIRLKAQGEVPAVTANPTVADTVNGTFDALGITAAPELVAPDATTPEAAQTTATEVKPSAPAAPTTTITTAGSSN